MIEPSAWIPVTEKVELAILGKALEECAELSKILSRILIQGSDEADPKTGESNLLALTNEIGDLSSATEFLIQFYKLDNHTITGRFLTKQQFHKRWHYKLEDF